MMKVIDYTHDSNIDSDSADDVRMSLDEIYVDDDIR